MNNKFYIHSVQCVFVGANKGIKFWILTIDYDDTQYYYNIWYIYRYVNNIKMIVQAKNIIFEKKKMKEGIQPFGFPCQFSGIW